MIKLVIFDLDDTLYPELDFVRSGFKVVSMIISRDFGFDSNHIYRLLLDLFNEDKKFVFNRLLSELNIYDSEYLDKLIFIYRNHYPNISLYEDAKEILNQFKENYLLGLITDGSPNTQRLKVKALNIESYFNCIIYTGEKGENYKKPSVYPFLDMINCLRVKSRETVYVGDNLEKDFKGPKDIGILTIRVLRDDGIYKNSIAHKNDFEPDYVINSLLELKEILKIL